MAFSSSVIFLLGKSRECTEEHKEKVCLKLKLSSSNCTYSDCTASDRLKVKLNSGVPAEHCTSITTQVESEFENGHFSTTYVGFKVFVFHLTIFKLKKFLKTGNLKLKIEYVYTYKGRFCDVFIFDSVSK